MWIRTVEITVEMQRGNWNPTLEFTVWKLKPTLKNHSVEMKTHSVEMKTHSVNCNVKIFVEILHPGTKIEKRDTINVLFYGIYVHIR